ncbi:uncharacterized protein LOC132709823 [Pantherophis guttatus]|uniref:Uncharacterized protein LOC132709823 n=1 Tax=Pantherophis guttatus TaxID=94885 RepID=A0ABM3YXB4_PANGU|nr:uncharacterized protein LOC132709823 [Pantherophis guttatus]
MLGCLAEAISLVGIDEPLQRTVPETDHFHPKTMMKTAASLLRDSRESLKKEIRNLRVKVSNLEAENPEIIKNTIMNEQKRSPEGQISCLAKEEKEFQEMFRELDDTKATLEIQNQTLSQTNQMLHSKIQKVSNNLIRFQASKVSRDQDILRMKEEVEKIVADVQRVEAKIETARRRYEERKKQSAELERMMVELEGICKAQDKEILFLEDRLGKPLQNTLFSVLSGGAWVLVALMVGLGFSNLVPFLINSYCLRTDR